MACTLVLHAGLVLGLRLAGRHPPACLDFPRLELFLGLFMINPVAQAAARKDHPPPLLFFTWLQHPLPKHPFFATLWWALDGTRSASAFDIMLTSECSV